MKAKSGLSFTIIERGEPVPATHKAINLANNRTAGAQYDTLSALLDFFRGQGLEIEVGDLFLVEEAA